MKLLLHIKYITVHYLGAEEDWIPLKGRRQRGQKHQSRSPGQTAAVPTGFPWSYPGCTSSSREGSGGEKVPNCKGDSSVGWLFYRPRGQGVCWEMYRWQLIFRRGNILFSVTVCFYVCVCVHSCVCVRVCVCMCVCVILCVMSQPHILRYSHLSIYHALLSELCALVNQHVEKHSNLSIYHALQSGLWRSLQHVDNVSLPHRPYPACPLPRKRLCKRLGSMDLHKNRVDAWKQLVFRQIILYWNNSQWLRHAKVCPQVNRL